MSSFALMQFVFVEGAVNAALIVIFMGSGILAWFMSDTVRNAALRPVPVVAAVAIALAAEVLTSTV
jgi:hypothetical protein